MTEQYRGPTEFNSFHFNIKEFKHGFKAKTALNSMINNTTRK